MGRLKSRPHLVGRIGSGVRVVAIFQKKIVPVLSYGRKRGITTWGFVRGIDLPPHQIHRYVTAYILVGRDGQKDRRTEPNAAPIVGAASQRLDLPGSTETQSGD